MLSTQDSEYLIDFSKKNWEQSKPEPNFQAAKSALFSNFWLFSSMSDDPLMEKLTRKPVSRKHFHTKSGSTPRKA